ncbi:FAD-binding oxidoreductase [Falsirhodobacter halotolerans]|uniref:FAD-binding oxidoreductase n=1 Tax=Falsirhodobacter halotolerans TaxID=1146892 RepID=UPI001FD11596|nr:FAD-binding oxidoreductase [Falsirhodobacter halotolerans]MCJ8139281.1 FAD-binding oxidoreductase [Falsirhodobacter halotolerans]
MSLRDADGAFLDDLAGRLPPDTVQSAEDRHLTEPRGRFRGEPTAVAMPRTVAETSAIIAACQAGRVPVVPIGGSTGLVGGQVMRGARPLLVSTERMGAVRGVYAAESTLVAEGGAILATVQAAAEEADRLFPLSLGSEGSARIGGLLATNAGGVNVLRYGVARELCLGIEAVLPDGSVLNGLRRLRKDNTGYDLRNLLIGAEGTLGLITAASLRLFPRPARTGTAFLVVPDPEAALRLLGLAQARLPGMIDAFELIARQSFVFLADAFPDMRRPFADPPDWAVLIELGLPASLDGGAELEALFEAGMAAGLALDGVIAASETQRRQFWHLRESIHHANVHVGAIASHDIALPLSSVPEFLRRAAEGLARFDIRVNCFGHLGDGNLHYNLFPAVGRRKGDYPDAAEMTGIVHDLVHDLDGSFSAEHGVGRLKVGELERYGDPARLAAMRAIKAALDPNGIMNPGAVLRI